MYHMSIDQAEMQIQPARSIRLSGTDACNVEMIRSGDGKRISVVRNTRTATGSEIRTIKSYRYPYI